jgi:hypothetical protein
LIVPEQQYQYIEIHYVTIGPSGEDGPKVRMKTTEAPASTVRTLIARAVEEHGVYDLKREVFHPWHSVLRVNWYFREPSSKELEDEAAEKYHNNKRPQSEYRERVDNPGDFSLPRAEY